MHMDIDCESITMEVKPLTREQIALNEKKMNMTLDDIIKMSKKATFKSRKPRALNKTQKFSNTGAAERNPANVRRFMDSRSSVRQGVLAQRRSNCQTNQFHLAISNAMKSAAAPICSRPLNCDRRVLAQRRSNSQNDQFHFEFANAMKSAAAPMRSRQLNHDRMVNWDKPRVGKSPFQRNTTQGSFSELQQMKAVSKKHRGTRTSDFLSVYIKKQRMMAQLNNSPWHFQTRVGFQHQQWKRPIRQLANKSIKPRINVFG